MLSLYLKKKVLIYTFHKKKYAMFLPVTSKQLFFFDKAKLRGDDLYSVRVNDFYN